MNAGSGSGVRTTVTLVVASVIFVVAVLLPKLLLEGSVLTLASTQGLELVLSLVAIAWLGRGRFADYGFRRPAALSLESGGKRRWGLFGLGALVLGMIASIALMTSGASGNPLIKNFTLPQIVLFVWMISSTIEEVFTRGFVQSHLSHLANIRVGFMGIHVSLPVLIGALVFASMHFVLLLTGADLTTVAIIWLFTFALGLLAGYQRAITGSLLPAIGVHVLANIGGVVGGIIYFTMRVLFGGPFPEM